MCHDWLIDWLTLTIWTENCHTGYSWNKKNVHADLFLLSFYAFCFLVRNWFETDRQTDRQARRVMRPTGQLTANRRVRRQPWRTDNTFIFSCRFQPTSVVFNSLLLISTIDLLTRQNGGLQSKFKTSRYNHSQVNFWRQAVAVSNSGKTVQLNKRRNSSTNSVRSSTGNRSLRATYYCEAVLIGRIRGLARPSVRLSVSVPSYLSVMYGLVTRKQKAQKNQNWCECSTGQE